MWGWGGRRPGAGAPPGNMNALKHGRRSERMAALGMFLTANAEAHAFLLSLAAGWEHKQIKAEDVAEQVFSQIIERGLKVGKDRQGESRLILLPPNDDRRSIETPTLEDAPDQTTEPSKTEPNNQVPRRTPRNQPRSVRKNPLDRTAKPLN